MQCSLPLGEHAVSDYYCSEECSRRWSAARTGYHEDYIDDDEVWAPDALSDLEPVSWIAPPVWRLPRSTGDLEADRLAAVHALSTATTHAQRVACAWRNQALIERQRVIWAREWRLPREAAEVYQAQVDLEFAERTATTDAQRAACALRREAVTARRHFVRAPGPLGRTTSWGFDSFVLSSPLRDFPVVTTEQAQRAANAILANHLTFRELAALTVAPREMLTYELRRDSDDNLMAMYTCPLGERFSMELPYYVDTTGCSWRILNSHGEVIRQVPVTSRRLWATPDPAPAVSEGDTIQVTHDGETLRYTVEAVGPGSSMTLRRHPQDGQPPIRGAEVAHAIVDEITPASPQARALQARRNRNTGPAPRPGRMSGNVPGARR